jgi:Tfp pilus assembly protein PilX
MRRSQHRNLLRMIRMSPRAPQLRPATDGGFAMPTAIIILFVVTMLTAAAIAVATQSSTSTTRDNNVKAEIEAAEAGLQVARYRLSQLKPTETQCIGESQAETAEASCKDSPEGLGNGATFQYWTTLPLKAGEKCSGSTVEAVAGVTQRCITSEGIVNGVKPGVRLQTSVKSSAGGSPLFPINGVVGLESVEFKNNDEIKANGGTNGKFSVGNNSSVEHVALGKSSPPGQPEGKGSWGPVTKEATDFTLAPVIVGASATVNSNSRIESGLDKSSGITYNGATRTLEAGELKLGGTVYNFCNLTLGNGATIEVLGEVKIYIDSPNDPGSKCKAGDGKFTFANNASIVNPSKDPTKLQIYIYDESGGPVEVKNNAAFYGVIYAPNSAVSIKNNAEFVGAVAAKSVSFKNNFSFSSDKRVESLLGGGGGGTYKRATWEQCTPGSGATEGC